MRSPQLVGVCFLLLAIVLVSLAIRLGNWWYVLLYPALSLAIVASAYLGAGPKVFGKRHNGRRHWLAGWLLAPYLLFANVTWQLVRLFERREPISPLDADVLLSRRLLSSELPEHVQSVVDLTCEFSDPLSTRTENYVCFPMLDAMGADPDELLIFAEFLSSLPRPMLIHCAQGHGRTGLLAATICLASGQARSAGDALAIVQRARPGIELNGAQQKTLQAIAQSCATLRFDGVYSEFDGALFRHLRFFEDGRVAFVLIGIPPHEVIGGLNDEYQARCGGTFQKEEGHIAFVITDHSSFGDVIVEYDGNMGSNFMRLDVYSRTTGHRSEHTFHFYEC